MTSRKKKVYKHRENVYLNVRDVATLMKIEPDCCGRVIYFERLPRNAFEQLRNVLSQSHLATIELPDCFTNPKLTLLVLQSIQSNDKLWKITLNLKNNGYNDACISVLVDLISRGIIQSLYFPSQVDEASAEKLLDAVLRSPIQLKKVNLAESALSEVSLEFLKNIIKKKKVTEELDMGACKGIGGRSGAMLTTDNLEFLKKAKPFMGGASINFFQATATLHITKENIHLFQVTQLADSRFFGNRGKSSKAGNRWTRLGTYLVRKNRFMPYQVLNMTEKKSGVSKKDIARKRFIETQVDDVCDELKKMQADLGKSDKSQDNHRREKSKSESQMPSTSRVQEDRRLQKWRSNSQSDVPKDGGKDMHVQYLSKVVHHHHHHHYGDNHNTGLSVSGNGLVERVGYNGSQLNVGGTHGRHRVSNESLAPLDAQQHVHDRGREPD